MNNAFIEARKRTGGSNLCLVDCQLWWQGKGGMLTSQLCDRIKTMSIYDDPPDFLIVHVGANDLGNMSVGDSRNKLQNTLRVISRYYVPGTKIIWSQMLPRFKWRYSSNLKAMETGRYGVNNGVASYVPSHGGYYIRYPEIVINQNLFQDDGGHRCQ